MYTTKKAHKLYKVRRSNNCIKYRMLPVACGVDLILNTFQSFDVGKCEPPLTQLTLTPTPHLTMAATWVLSGTRPTASRITAQLQSSHLHAHCEAVTRRKVSAQKEWVGEGGHLFYVCCQARQGTLIRPARRNWGSCTSAALPGRETPTNRG